MSSYIIITPAHNEESFIEKTIQSVIKQTMLPTKWVVVNDGSTDRTAEIVEQYCSEYAFLKLVNTQRSSGRHFANKVAAFNRGLTEVAGLNFEFIGNLDADVSLERNYYQNILSQFEMDPKLGIAGGIVFTKMGNGFDTDDETLDSVGGAVQLFRRTCFEQIGGYIALPYGGIDAAAEITARMKGWRVQKFPENKVFEHRRTGTAAARPVAARLNEGRRFHSLGYGALFLLPAMLISPHGPPHDFRQ